MWRECVEFQRRVDAYRLLVMTSGEECQPIYGALHEFGEYSRVISQVRWLRCGLCERNGMALLVLHNDAMMMEPSRIAQN